MHRHVSIAIAVFVSAAPVAVAAQDAAETAVILSGTGQAQGRAQRSLGQSISRSMGNAADAIAATQAQSQGRTYRPRAARRGGAGHFAIALPARVDPLENTDAPTYALANGASIRVSGGLRVPLDKQVSQPPEADCGANCPQN